MIPFVLHPISWGLKGKLREKTRIEYTMIDGYDKELALIGVEYTDGTTSYDMLKSDLDFKYHKLTPEEYETKLVERMDDSIEKSIRAFEVLNKYNHITDFELEKEIATLNNEPWVRMDSEYDPSEGLDGFAFKLDWNDQYIDFLREEGYEGEPDEIMDHWMVDICKIAAVDEDVPYFNPATVISSLSK